MPGVFGRNNTLVDPTTCFVMMPFAENFSAIYRLIHRCCTEQGLACTRADEDAKPGKITSRIYDCVARAGVVIADMTGRNANVFYELGLAHAISDNVILLTQSTEDVPFDLRDFIHIRYTNTFDGAEKLATDLSKAITTIVRSAEVPASREKIELIQDHANESSDDDVDFDLAHLKAEIARGSGDGAKAAAILKAALAAARLGNGDASSIGNCAIEAEQCKLLDVAEGLYEVALQKEPTHVNNRQCYVSFLLDHRSGDTKKMEIASKLLDELETVPERRERTRALRAQYLTRTKKQSGIAADLDKIVAEMLGDGHFTSIEQAAPALMVLQRSGRFDELLALVEQLQKCLPEQSAVLDRIVADAFAGSGDPRLRTQAIAMYTRLLDVQEMVSPDLKHNLATLLYAQDRVDSSQRAAKLWTEAYSERPHDSAIRKAFAQYLVRHKREADAAKVLSGEPLR